MTAFRVALNALSWENLAKYRQYCRIYGFINATRLAFRRLGKPRGRAPSDVTPILSASLPRGQAALFRLEKIVSVIIPTKNSGRDLKHLLRRLKAQEGLKECELIVVDSGSTDGTVLLAREEGARVLEIPAEQFTHSFARNRGAEAAKGDYLLFTVQDAMPLTKHWLWEMVNVLETENLAAVSCAEYPRSDSDLFYQFLIHTQYDCAPLNRDRILAWEDSCSSYLGLRANAQLSDVAALIRTDIFKQYRFHTPYAEDVDLGIRLIQDGYRLAFLQSTRILHSHNRPPYYFLKRAYTDARSLAGIFTAFVTPEITDSKRLYSEIVCLWNGLQKLAEVIDRWTYPMSTRAFRVRIEASDWFCRDRSEHARNGSDQALQEFINSLVQRLGDSSIVPDRNRSMLLPHVSKQWNTFYTWVCSIHDAVDRDVGQAIIATLEKIVALHVGTHLGYLLLTCNDRGCLDEVMTDLDVRLRAAV